MSEWQRAVSIGKRDAAEPEVIEAFERGGAKVWRISGKDLPDLVVGYRSVNHLVEVKTDRAKLRAGQSRCHAEWTGERPVVARTRAHAKKWLRVWSEHANATRIVFPKGVTSLPGTVAVGSEVIVGGECSGCGDACTCTPASAKGVS